MIELEAGEIRASDLRIGDVIQYMKPPTLSGGAPKFAESAVADIEGVVIREEPPYMEVTLEDGFQMDFDPDTTIVVHRTGAGWEE